MPVFLVVALLNSSGSTGKVIDHVIAADLATAQAKVTNAAAQYLADLPGNTKQAQIGLIQMNAAFTVIG